MHLLSTAALLVAAVIALSHPSCHAASTDAEEGASAVARILAEKRIMNKYLVEQKDIIVNYHLYNVGRQPATGITVQDDSLSPEYFETVSGSASFAVARLEAGENVSHTVVFRTKPGVWGRFNFTSAVVTYLPSPDAKTPQTGLTSEPGEGYIATQRDFERKFSPHTMDWIAFALMTLPCLLLPFYLWHKSKSKYDRLASGERGGSGAAASQGKHVNKTVKAQ